MRLGDLILLITLIIIFVISFRYTYKHFNDRDDSSNKHTIKLSLSIVGVLIGGFVLFGISIMYLNTIKLW